MIKLSQSCSNLVSDQVHEVSDARSDLYPASWSYYDEVSLEPPPISCLPASPIYLGAQIKGSPWRRIQEVRLWFYRSFVKYLNSESRTWRLSRKRMLVCIDAEKCLLFLLVGKFQISELGMIWETVNIKRSGGNCQTNRLDTTVFTAINLLTATTVNNLDVYFAVCI